MKRLVISEKTKAASRIAYILSDGNSKRKSTNRVPVFEFEDDEGEWKVVGLRGHIIEVDYPDEYNDWGSVDPEELINAPIEKQVRAKGLVSVLRDLARESDEIIIATDYDREGELIGLETVRLLNVDPGKIKRAKFSALTKHEIEEAFSSLKSPDEKLAESAESRQIVDLTWGASLTRFLSLTSGQLGHDYLSAGRVQSPTLNLVVDRHKEIRDFVPQLYWEISGEFSDTSHFRANHEANPFWDEDEAQLIMEKVEESERATVAKWETKEKKEYPPPPFNTTIMLAEANKRGLSASRAMSVAEDLYNNGFISYPRTDNTVYPRSLSLKHVLKKLKESEFKKEAEELLSQEKIKPSRGKSYSTDHPPIHPVRGATKKKLKGDRWKLYELIVRRFMATVAPPARAQVTNGELRVNEEAFVTKGYKILFPGWRKYYPYYRVEEIELPELSEGDGIAVEDIVLIRKETEPPRRYSQGALLQEMEKHGLGTKSTRHGIIQKLYDRKYIEGSYPVPTRTGLAVTESLSKYATPITRSEMTSQLEEDMQKIASGDIALEDVVDESREMLTGVFNSMKEHKKEIGDEIRTALREQKYVGECPECGGNLRIVKSRKGTFIGCSNYPNCTCTFSMPKGAKVETTDEVCDSCGLPCLRVIRRGKPVSLQCIDPDCSSNVERTTLGECPDCGQILRIRYSRKGKRFVGCTGWPNCKNSYPLWQKGTVEPTGRSCDSCGAPVVEMVIKDNKHTSCINPDCPSKED